MEEVAGAFVPRAELQEEFRRRDDQITSLQQTRWAVIGITSIGGILWWVIQSAPHLLTLLQVTHS